MPRFSERLGKPIASEGAGACEEDFQEDFMQIVLTLHLSIGIDIYPYKNQA